LLEHLLVIKQISGGGPISTLGSRYPPTCLGATMLLISAPGPRNTWACSTAAFI